MRSKATLLIVLVCFASIGGVLAQNAPIDFESGGYGASWTWATFENDSNPPLEIVANPSATGINTSATVASLTTLTTGQPWAGCESQHGADIGPFSFDVTNSTVKVMVYKSVISDVGVKFAEANGEAQPEVKVANTVINEWEELTFDLSGSIGAGITGVVDQIIIFPDFDLAGRTTDNVCYFDNITFTGQELPPGPSTHAPLPAEPAEDVISIFSDSYTNIAGTNFYPDWGQATEVSEVLIEGNNTLLFTGLNYQGIELGSAQNLSGMENLHVDFWSENSTALSVFLISTGPVEAEYVFEVSTDSWLSVDIPLSAFAGVDLADVFQLKFVGDGDVYLDNLYFLGEVTVIEEGPNAPITFETDGYGASWTWATFENDSNPPLEIVANPSATGINTSATVASLTTLTTGQPWAGCESQHGADIGPFSFDVTNSTVKVMVYKSVISDVGVKFAEANGEAQPEVKVANTVINEWEELTFDLSGSIGAGITGIVDQIIIFPDFDLAGRTTDNVCYFDNITFSEQAPVSNEPNAPMDFEIGGYGADWTWIVAENGTNPDLEIIDNPVSGGINTTATVAQFTALQTGQQWALFYSDDIGQFAFDATNAIVKIMVNKPVISNVGVKFEGASGNMELLVPNTLTNEWEELTFDFSDQIGTTYNRVVIIPDFAARTQDNIMYVDNLTFNSSTTNIEDNLVPDYFALKQNYPNPFNPSTTISFSLEHTEHVTLKVYNIAGQEVATLLDGRSISGDHSVQFNADEFAAGTYLYSLTVGQQSSVKKMVLIK